MSELRLETLRLPAAALSADNPLPPLDRPTHYQPKLSSKPESDPESGYLPDYLPYTMQDSYTRERPARDLNVAVLENEILRATFLLDYGGRLWSLLHKPSGRDLLYVNPIFQPANLALRNAWFSGGVEWNMGVIGHTPFTCAPIFAARLKRPDGTPILRLYEWERIRQAAYQIDAYLPDGSAALYVRVRIVNPHDHALPMYWWSNIAVPERADVRVLVPAADAYQYALSIENLNIVAIPNVEGKDISYTTHSRRAADYFFRIPPERRPWISALDKDGKGLIQTSTDGLRGRKLFLWGTGQGGTRWQEWLNDTGKYLEIQAGLAPTQLEYATLAPHAEVAWLEAYGLMQADAQIVHGDDWSAATAQVDARLEQLIPRAAFDAEFERGKSWQDQAPDEVLHRGSGWGELEVLRRAKADETPFAGSALDFSGALGDVQQAWLDLLNTGRFPDTEADMPRAGLLAQAEWLSMLETALAEHDGGWEAWLHLGVMRLHAGDVDGAHEAWETSLVRKRTAWALRNLALITRQSGQLEEAANLYREAQQLQPDLIALLIEAGRVLIDAGRSAEFLQLLETLPQTVRDHGRIHLLEVEAGLASGDLDRVGRLFENGFEINDYQEGDEILTDLWQRYHAERISQHEGIPVDDALCERVEREYPLPKSFDFRMT